jgi:hypothetical protein
LVSLHELADLPEKEFHQALVQTLEKTGRLGDVFPAMVTYNVPLFLLKKLWPECIELIKKSRSIAFAAAEEGWRGRVEHISSTIDENGVLNFSKSYVLESEKVLLLVRCREEKQFALALINFSDADQKDERKEIALQNSSDERIGHYRIKGNCQAEAFQKISQSAYSRQAIFVPLREASSLALLAASLLRRSGKSSFEKECAAIMEARGLGKIKREILEPVREILSAFYSADIEREPFWAEINKMLGRLLEHGA